MATGSWDSHKSTTKTVIPNRIFVGGIAPNTTEDDLRSFFQKLGNVKGTKILFDRIGVSRGYGFVTFETQEEAQRILKEFDCVTLKGQKLNIAPAVKKQQYEPLSHLPESNYLHNPAVVWPVPPFSSNSVNISRDSMYYPQSACPMVWPQMYMQQQYPSNASGNVPQLVYTFAPVDYPYTGPPSDYGETSSVDSGETTKKSGNKPVVMAQTVVAYPSRFVMMKDEAGYLTPPTTPATEFDNTRRN